MNPTGLRGSERSVQRALPPVRQAQTMAPKRLSLQTVFPSVIQSRLSRLTPSRVTWMVLRTARPRTPEEDLWLSLLIAQPSAVTTAITLAQDFATLVPQRQVETFEPWLKQAQHTPFVPFQRFAVGWCDDDKAVQAALA